MLSKDDVDICVTCITNKPQQLPLREAFESLGIEVVLNARGIGAKAVKHETKKQIRALRKEQVANEQRQHLWCFFWKSHKQKLQEERDRKRIERALRKKMLGLTYGTYNHRLNDIDSSSVGSVSTWGTNSTIEQLDPADVGYRLDESVANAFALVPSTQEPIRTNDNDRPSRLNGAADFRLDDSVANAFASSSAAEELEGRNSNGTTAALGAVSVFEAYRFLSSNESRNEKSEQSSMSGIYEKSEQGSMAATYTMSDVVPMAEPTDGDSSSDESLYVGQQSDQNSVNGTHYGAGGSQYTGSSFSTTPWSDAHNTDEESQHSNLVSHASVPNQKEGDRSYFQSEEHGLPDIDDQDDDSIIDSNIVVSKTLPRQSSQAVEIDTRMGRERIEANRISESQALGEEPQKKATMKNMLSAKNILCALSSGGCGSSDLHAMVLCETHAMPLGYGLDGTLPLHELCDREFPDRFSNPEMDIVAVAEDLVVDIMTCRESLDTVTASYPGACLIQNEEGDLPVHLLTRRLIEWEALWQEKIRLVEKVALWKDAAKFTRLHKTMGECVDVVLNPIAHNRLACRSRGRLGSRILPIHAAAMFAVPFDTMQTLLESYPESASVPCDLGGLRTHVTNQSLPLELLERRRSEWLPVSTDSTPSWCNTEERVSSGHEDVGGIQWSQSTLNSPNLAEDLISRSDLLFAFHPNILPFRKDATRVQRIEVMIRAEAQRAIGCQADKANYFDLAARSAWIWMCTFDDSTDDQDTYVDSVRRIVNALDIPAVKFLASADTRHGTVIDTAQPKCRQIIQLRLDGATEANETCRIRSRTTLQKEGSRRSILKQKDPCSLHSLSDGPVPKETLCREVFNVLETTIPTSFIIMPYPLCRNEHGSLVLESPTQTSVAIQFSECMTKMTEPWHIHHVLEKKAMTCLGHQLSPERTAGFNTTDWKRAKLLRSLLDLYKGDGFLYFLDQTSGAPIVPSASDSKLSPQIRLDNAVEAVERLLPLMLMGMIQMRGEKSIFILAATMAQGKREPPDNWVTLSQNLLRFLYSLRNKQRNGGTEVVSEELISLCNELEDFVSRTTKRNAKRRPQSDDGREWFAELSYLKILYDQCDDAIADIAQLSSTATGKEEVPRTEIISASTTDVNDEKAVTENCAAIAASPTILPEHASKNGAVENDATTDAAAVDEVNVSACIPRASVDTEAIQQYKDEKDSAHACISANHGNRYSSVVLQPEVGENDSGSGDGGASFDEDDDSRVLNNLLSDDAPSTASSDRWGTSKPPLASPEKRSTRPLKKALSSEAKKEEDNETLITAQTLPDGVNRRRVDTRRAAYVNETNPFAKIHNETLEKLDAIKKRLANLNRENEKFMGEGEPTVGGLWNTPLLNDERSVRSHDEATSSEEDYTMMLMSRVSGLEERILEREIEIQGLNLDVFTLEMNSADASDESDASETSLDDNSSFMSEELEVLM